jgi:hypothetical protein
MGQSRPGKGNHFYGHLLAAFYGPNPPAGEGVGIQSGNNEQQLDLLELLLKGLSHEHIFLTLF